MRPPSQDVPRRGVPFNGMKLYPRLSGTQREKTRPHRAVGRRFGGIGLKCGRVLGDGLVLPGSWSRIPPVPKDPTDGPTAGSPPHDSDPLGGSRPGAGGGLGTLGDPHIHRVPSPSLDGPAPAVVADYLEHSIQLFMGADDSKTVSFAQKSETQTYVQVSRSAVSPVVRPLRVILSLVQSVRHTSASLVRSTRISYTPREKEVSMRYPDL